MTAHGALVLPVSISKYTPTLILDGNGDTILCVVADRTARVQLAETIVTLLNTLACHVCDGDTINDPPCPVCGGSGVDERAMQPQTPDPDDAARWRAEDRLDDMRGTP